jgi:signal transduction histidine kinase
MGIPDAELGKVGRRFFRASNAKAATGTGLGVYSARRLLAFHGATLQLGPNDGRGTAAIIRLPLAKSLPDRIPSEGVAA